MSLTDDRFAFVDPDGTRRADPADVIAALRPITESATARPDVVVGRTTTT